MMTVQLRQVETKLRLNPTAGSHRWMNRQKCSIEVKGQRHYQLQRKL